MFVKRQPKYHNLKYISLFSTLTCLTFIMFFIVIEYASIIPLIKISKIIVHTALTSITTCRPYIPLDNRPFFERDYPQSNLPQRISNASYENILRQLPSLRLVVLGCARNVVPNLNEFRSHIEPIINLFHSSSRIIIFESDSKDKTAKKLREWSRVELHTYRRLAGQYPERTERLAHCRNELMDKAHLLPADYIFVVDLDRFSTTVPSFLSNFQYDTNQWSVMTATSHDTYYDIWALRTLSDSVMNYDVWHRMLDLEIPLNNYCHQSIFNGIIGIHQKRIPIEHGLIEVRSAFNGAGLYKVNSTYNCKYDGRRFTCEHVSFHLCIREKNQARIFINPEFQVS
ncbi:unnamed protein product [Adineta steineri]|uniref:Uncharacterized protein n=1 Tax=Adineta steineri TaxID=433720 RepID=A0A814QVQ4_9BILA|nr:unnamed protein product [Adineta steineri]CAF1146009.1 unnamed protein product [Adineta steineri]